MLRLRVEDFLLTKGAESTPSVASSFEDCASKRLMNKKLWKNEKKLKKERKRYYAALAEEIGESRKEDTQQTQHLTAESPNNKEQEMPVWFITAMEKVVFC